MFLVRKLISPFNVQASKTVKEKMENLLNVIYGQIQRL